MFRRKEKYSVCGRNCTSDTSVNSVNFNPHFLGPQSQKILPTDVINSVVHNSIRKWAHIQAVGQMRHTKRFPRFLLKATVTREINSLRMILQFMRKVFVTYYRTLNTENNGTEQNFHVMSQFRLQRKKSIN
jgi:hypothetical protein